MKSLFYLLFFISCHCVAQNVVSKELKYDEFLGYVKKYHPLVKSANLEIGFAQANLMMARGGFDPKIEVDFEQKKFKDSESNPTKSSRSKKVVPF